MKPTGKQWFVILNQWEIEKCSSSAQIVIFMAIKSFCGNGKLKRGISVREITARSKYSIGWVRRVVVELREIGLVFTHGTETRRGGSVEVFSVGTEVNNQSVPLAEGSVQPVSRSVPSLGTNLQQSNKAIKEKELDNTFSSGQPLDVFPETILLLNRKGGAQGSFGAGLDHDKLWNIAQEASDNFIKRKEASNA